MFWRLLPRPGMSHQAQASLYTRVALTYTHTNTTQAHTTQLVTQEMTTLQKYWVHLCPNMNMHTCNTHTIWPHPMLVVQHTCCIHTSTLQVTTTDHITWDFSAKLNVMPCNSLETGASGNIMRCTPYIWPATQIQQQVFPAFP